MIVAGWVVVGFFSAIGWWSANHYIIEPYFPEKIVKEKPLKENNE